MIVLYLLAIILSVDGACPTCDTSSCPKDPERDCPLGPAPDPCLCCPQGICGLDEGRPCYNASIFRDLPEKKRLGPCASNMLCILRTDLGPDELETVCKCAEQRVACGSNNKTYESTCKMYRAEGNTRVTLQHWGPCHHEQRVACGSNNKTYESTCKMYRAEGNTRVTLQHWGPCHHAPQITTEPEGMTVIPGQPIVLDCEAKGFPVPSITWEFVASDSSVMVLPGDDPLVSIQIRGGPETLMVTSWVQIQQARKTDSGTYSCIATNNMGASRVIANLTVR